MLTSTKIILTDNLRSRMHGNIFLRFRISPKHIMFVGEKKLNANFSFPKFSAGSEILEA